MAWLYRIAAHEISDGRQAAARFIDQQPPEAASDPGFDRRIALFELVESLPDDQRRAIELRFGEGRSIRETTEALGRSEGAVKQLQRRALERLRAMVEETNC